MAETIGSPAQLGATKPGLRLAFVLGLGLVACGGGGGAGGNAAAGGAGTGGGPGPASVPTIVASVFANAPGMPPPWKSASSRDATADVAVRNPADGTPIATAAVRINGADVGYNPGVRSYITFFDVAPGDPVSFTVTLDGASYSASGRMPTEYPTIVSPADGATWSAGAANTIAWTVAAPVAGSSYTVAVFDRTGRMLWPADNTFLSVAPPASSVTVPAGSLSGGAAVVAVGILDSVPVMGAAAGSGFAKAGSRYVAITVGP